MNTPKDLFKKYNSGEATAEEKAIVETWYLKYPANATEFTTEELILEQEKSLLVLNQTISKTLILKRLKVVGVAASVLLCFGLGAYIFQAKDLVESKGKIERIANSSSKLGNSAILTLDNGRKIVLNESTRGQIVNESGIRIEKIANGQLVYTLTNANTSKADAINTIETPIRSQFLINLPDGSKVWLNAASKLKYPVNFNDTERKVELIGEAYFEIARNYGKGKLAKQKIPFIVSAGNQNVTVLGTNFNISAYADEETIKTSLLEGSVSVSLTGEGLENPKETLLLPGQMAVNWLNDAKIKVTEFDRNDVIAWKEGYFIFNNENIKVIMKKLSHWYGFEVEYRGDMTGVEFQGNYLRSRDLWNLLKTIEMTNKVIFKEDGRRIIVSRKH